MALALALPLFFHLFGLGSVFLPMLLPVITAGFLIEWQTAVSVGFLAPLLSAFLTGMPPIVPPIAFMMMVELALLGLMPALLYRKLRMNLYVTLVVTLIVNRGMVFLLRFILAQFFHIPGLVYSLAVITAGFPGIAIQLIVVPIVVRSIEQRYRTRPRAQSHS